MIANSNTQNQNSTPSFWTDERTAVLRTRWAAGDSAGVIANQIGTTRNSIIGKTRRLKLEGRETKTVARGKGLRTRTFTPKPRKPHVSVATRWGAYSAESKPGEVPPTPLVDLVPLNIPFADIRSFQCRWVTSENTFPATFCGHSAFVGSWCPAHRAVVSQPLPARRKVAEEV